MSLEIINQTEEALPEAFLEQAYKDYLDYLKSRDAWDETFDGRTLQLVFLNEREAKNLNHQFRGKNYATDVLSFESVDPDSYGELIFCSQILKKQAHDHNLSFEYELAYMLFHGILHLLGFDHETNDEDAKEMFALQDEAFEMLKGARS